MTQERKVVVRATSSLEAHQVAEDSFDSTKQDNIDCRRPQPEVIDVHVSKDF